MASRDLPPPEHIGLWLHRAAEDWRRRFEAEMVARGYPVFAEARAVLIPLLTLSGVRQSSLAGAARMSKQAVQQHLDGLVGDGLVERVPDPADARGKLVRFTQAGREMLREGGTVKSAIEADLKARIGKERFQSLCDVLQEITASDTVK